jgi:hypothetical protein
MIWIPEFSRPGNRNNFSLREGGADANGISSTSMRWKYSAVAPSKPESVPTGSQFASSHGTPLAMFPTRDAAVPPAP